MGKWTFTLPVNMKRLFGLSDKKGAKLKIRFHTDTIEAIISRKKLAPCTIRLRILVKFGKYVRQAKLASSSG